jgi:hypothetical protein
MSSFPAFFEGSTVRVFTAAGAGRKLRLEEEEKRFHRRGRRVLREEKARGNEKSQISERSGERRGSVTNEVKNLLTIAPGMGVAISNHDFAHHLLPVIHTHLSSVFFSF